MDESVDIPDLEDVQDLATAKFLLKYVVRALESQTQTLESQTQTLESQTQTLESQTQTMELLRDEIADLKRALFGQKSERVMPVNREITKRKRANETPAEAATRKEKARQKREKQRKNRRQTTPTEVVEHPVVDVSCRQCGLPLQDAAKLADEVTEEYEYVPARIIRREHHRQRKVCSCACFHYGDFPQRVVEGGLNGPGLHAHVAVAKCADSLPLDRQARAFKRAGVALSKSTLCDIFHRDAELLAPLAHRVLKLAAASSHINADETSVKVLQRKVCRRAYLWDFIATDDAGNTMVAYRFSPSRSGQTPIEVLGESTGILQVDGYTGYNQVTTPNKRKRAGCWAHARRKFFDALKTTPEQANHAIDLIRQIYEVEYEVAEKGLLGTEQHRALRRTKSREAVDAFFQWAIAQKPKARPKSPLGVALKYALNQRRTLECFLDDPKVSLDNNIAEQYLRLIALGRKNFLFVGHDEAGHNLAVLQTLVSTCLANKVNPQSYLTDVLLRIQDHPQSQIEELLPWNWHPPPDPD